MNGAKLSGRSRILAIALIGACLGGILELALRHYGFGSPLLYRASAAGYELVPGQKVVRLGHVTTINALGTRGPEAPALPAEGVQRVLVLGDSVANGGTQANDDETWPLLTQQALNAPGQASGLKAEVLNASAGGWALGNEAAWLGAHGWFGAKWLVWEINGNDLDQPFVPSALLDHNAAFPSHRPRTAIGEALTRYVLPRLGLADPGIDPGATMGATAGANTPQVLATVKALFEQARQAGVGVTVLYWDAKEPLSPAMERARAQLFELAARYQIAIVRPNLAADPRAPALFRDQIHPNTAGNAAVAKILAPALMTSLKA